MKYNKVEQTACLYVELWKLGFNLDEIKQLIRIEKTLQRWGELECGNFNNHPSWYVVRDEETGKTYMETHPYQGEFYRRPYPDRKTAALKRLAKIMEPRKRRLIAYYQSDPRGCALWIVRKKDIKGMDVQCCYTRGIAVCI
jgi:hypothetical protein